MVFDLKPGTLVGVVVAVPNCCKARCVFLHGERFPWQDGLRVMANLCPVQVKKRKTRLQGSEHGILRTAVDNVGCAQRLLT